MNLTGGGQCHTLKIEATSSVNTVCYRRFMPTALNKHA